LEGPLGILISLIIIKSSIHIIMYTIDDMIGTRIDSNLSKSIKKYINSFDNVFGAYDLNLTNYGPDTLIGSINIEVPDKMTAKEIHLLTKEISYKVFEKFGIILTLGIYASSNDKESLVVKKELDSLVKDYPSILQVHGFYLDKKTSTVYFDIVIDFKEESPVKVRKSLTKDLSSKFPNYKYIVVVDSDLSD